MNIRDYVFNTARISTLGFLGGSLIKQGRDYFGYKTEKEIEDELRKENEKKEQLQMYKNPEFAKTERQRVQKKIEFIKSTPLVDNNVINTKYNKMLNRLNALNNKVSSITNTSYLPSKILLDELKYTVLLKHLEAYQKPKNTMPDIPSIFSIGAWCGAGTDVLKNLEDESQDHISESFKIDRICKKHDLAYSRAKHHEDIHKADIEMLLSILDEFTVKGVKDVVYQIADLNQATIDKFMNHIQSILFTAGTNPMNLFSLGYKTTVNYLGAKRTLEFLPQAYRTLVYGEIPQLEDTSLLNIANSGVRDYYFIHERPAALVGFGAIALKLFYDLAIGRKNIYINPETGEYTNGVYGWEKTRFKPEEIEYIIKDFEKIENERLKNAGYDNIDFVKLISLDDDEFNKVIEEPIYKEVVEDEVISEEDIEEDVEQINDDIFDNTREATEDEIDILDVGEYNTFQNYINYLNNLDLEKN